MAESEKLLLETIEAWRKGLLIGGLRVNFGKSKIMKCEIIYLMQSKKARSFIVED